MAKLIEIAGLPGSGKSSVGAPLLKALRTAGYAPRFPADYLKKVGSQPLKERFAPRRPEFHSTFHLSLIHARHRDFISALYQTPGPTEREIYWVNYTLLAYALFEYFAEDREVLIVDEGVFNRMCAILVECDAPSLVGRLFETMPLANDVIFLDVPPEAALERTIARRRRGHNMRMRMTKKYGGVERLTAWRERFLEGGEVVRERGASFLTIASSPSPEDAAARIFEFIT